jgi:hypothetical protein
MTWKFASRAICAAVLMAASAEFANAALVRISTNTNLRQGPGTHFAVLGTAPAGTVVNVIRCGVEWCNVLWAGRPGYMIARNVGRAGPAPVRVVRPAPRVVVVEPPPPAIVVAPGPYYYGPGYYGRRYYGPRGYWGYRRW